ncbi:hypothetical protein ACNRC9_01225, partial [Ralstonia pseudosolanacearum]|uniref:hypothetical protein n=1 Tax=Ralstonia pseudosolanacearum TaxID=1310165 RepID=UPI003AAE7B23
MIKIHHLKGQIQFLVVKMSDKGDVAPKQETDFATARRGATGLGLPDVVLPRRPPVAGIAERGGIPAGVNGQDQTHQI